MVTSDWPRSSMLHRAEVRYLHRVMAEKRDAKLLKCSPQSRLRLKVAWAAS